MKTRIVMRNSAMDGRPMWWPEYFSWISCLVLPVIYISALLFINFVADRPPRVLIGILIFEIISSAIVMLVSYKCVAWRGISHNNNWHFYSRSAAEMALASFLKESK